MNIDLSGRVAVITGGAKGIGRATANAFAKAGARVAVWDRAVADGQELVSQLVSGGADALFANTDVTERASVNAAVAATISHFGAIDILINNAGITRDAQLAKVKDGAVIGGLSEEDFDAVIAVNLKGVYNCMQAVVPHLIAKKRGRVLNASSVVAMHGNFGQTNYVAAKTGVIGMTQVWARELGKHGITVNAIAPGFISTDMTQKMPPSVLENMQAHTPVGRLGTPDDCAAAYLFLASDQASFINGAVLRVDGGLVIGT